MKEEFNPNDGIIESDADIVWSMVYDLPKSAGRTPHTLFQDDNDGL